MKLRGWMLDAMEYGSLRANAWLLVSWLGGDKLVRWASELEAGVTLCARSEDREFPARVPHG